MMCVLPTMSDDGDPAPGGLWLLSPPSEIGGETKGGGGDCFKDSLDFLLAPCTVITVEAAMALATAADVEVDADGEVGFVEVDDRVEDVTDDLEALEVLSASGEVALPPRRRSTGEGETLLVSWLEDEAARLLLAVSSS